MIPRSMTVGHELGASRRHSSPPPAERTRGTDDKSVPSDTAPHFPAFVAPAGGEVGRGAVEQSTAPRSGNGRSGSDTGARPSANLESSLDLATRDRTAMRLL